MNNIKHYTAIITAGGSGKRLNSSKKKQFIKIAGKPILFWTLERFLTHGSFTDIILSLPETDMPVYKKLVSSAYPDKLIKLVAGGTERQQSVLNALRACDPKTDIVFIHDGVRPFIKKQDLDNLLKRLESCDAAILGAKEKNTLKIVSSNKIEKTVPRAGIYKAFTPQVFRYDQILKLHEKARNVKFNFTDDASILEYFNYDVEVVECGDYNIKITEPADLQYAEYILKNSLFEE